MNKHIDGKLFFRLRIFSIIFIIMLGFMIYDIFQQTISFALAGEGLLLGIAIGIIAARMFVTKWHELTNKVVSQIDGVGAVVIVFYALFSVFRNGILGYWLHGATLTAFSFSIIGGIMLGRLLATIHNIKNILSKRGIIY